MSSIFAVKIFFQNGGGAGRGGCDEPAGRGGCGGREARAGRRGFTMIEVMIVVGIVAIIMAMGLPSFARMYRKGPMRQAMSDVQEACGKARSEAILKGVTVELRIDPKGKRLSVGGVSAGNVEEDPFAKELGTGGAAAAAVTGFSATLAEDIVIELLAVNLNEVTDEEDVAVRFYPNGTADEFWLVLRSGEGEIRKFSLEVTTALVQLEVIK